MAKTTGLQFVGVREFKEKLTGFLGRKKEVVVTRHGKPIARIIPVQKGSPEDLLLEIGMILTESGVSKEEALQALKTAGKTVYG
jgi:prevent-host-death family protein